MRLNPPILFENLSCHIVRTKAHFANSTQLHIIFMQKLIFFCNQTTNRWNSLLDVLKEHNSYADFYNASNLHFHNLNDFLLHCFSVVLYCASCFLCYSCSVCCFVATPTRRNGYSPG